MVLKILCKRFTSNRIDAMQVYKSCDDLGVHSSRTIRQDPPGFEKPMSDQQATIDVNCNLLLQNLRETKPGKRENGTGRRDSPSSYSQCQRGIRKVHPWNHQSYPICKLKRSLCLRI